MKDKVKLGMAVVVALKPITEEELKLVREEYDTYVKVVVDVSRGILGAGGEWHYDAEQVLLRQGSKQEDLWGGGVDLENGLVEYNSLINTRPNLNQSQEVLDLGIRQQMFEIIKKIFGKYVKA